MATVDEDESEERSRRGRVSYLYNTNPLRITHSAHGCASASDNTTNKCTSSRRQSLELRTSRASPETVLRSQRTNGIFARTATFSAPARALTAPATTHVLPRLHRLRLNLTAMVTLLSAVYNPLSIFFISRVEIPSRHNTLWKFTPAVPPASFPSSVSTCIAPFHSVIGTPLFDHQVTHVYNRALQSRSKIHPGGLYHRMLSIVETSRATSLQAFRRTSPQLDVHVRSNRVIAPLPPVPSTRESDIGVC